MSDDDAMMRALFSDSEVERRDASAELDAQPREPGRFKVVVGEAHPREGGYEMVCEDCGQMVRSRGGISFGDPEPCAVHGSADMFAECFVVHLHWSSQCPAWRHRLYRFDQRFGWGRLQRRRMGWRWRSRSRRERADPDAWKNYWSDGGVA